VNLWHFRSEGPKTVEPEDFGGTLFRFIVLWSFGTILVTHPHAATTEMSEPQIGAEIPKDVLPSQPVIVLRGVLRISFASENHAVNV
jgi:hypothetical protein